ncbi:class IV adenylate cyclase [Nocardia arthritidis]|uniref:class IV adenylate cyclase n=1 Tax=Nocardia arthritidis TaxID=228602 RepID=UPI0015832287|nr:class IV adenylate cyclase [Nocardia arthritidis]
MIEAEFKAKLTDPGAVRARLEQRARPEQATYRDTYFDTANHALAQADRELRLRTVITGNETRELLTFKDAAVDAATGSKPEFEVMVGEREPMARIIAGLGYEPAIELTKRCENFRFVAAGRELLASLVTVPEIDGVFLELETHAAEQDLRAALDDLRTVLSELGVSEDQLTTELYTDAVARHR